MSMKIKLKGILSDAAWSLCGLVLMNVVAQFVVYPSWNRQLGSEAYGDVLYLLSLMNIIGVSLGSSCNYARVTEKRKGHAATEPILRLLLTASLAVPLFVLGISCFSGIVMSALEWVLYVLLVIATMWRYYADVEYRLSLDYKGYFCYYLLISAGYGVGIFLSGWAGCWPLALLPGEVLGLLRVKIKGTNLNWEKSADRAENQAVIGVALTLFATGILSNLVFNGDRLLLRTFVGGEAVTIYYLASLLGKTMTLITTPLNSVIIGYLVRMDNKLDIKFMSITTVLAAGAIALATVACTIGSYILIPILYPGEFAAARAYFVIGNLTQIIYFVAGVLIVILLRYCDSRYQVYVNVIYAIAFVVICIPMTVCGGFRGFCVGLLITGLCRFAAAIALGYRDALTTSKAK